MPVVALERQAKTALGGVVPLYWTVAASELLQESELCLERRYRFERRIPPPFWSSCLIAFGRLHEGDPFAVATAPVIGDP